MLFSLLPSCRVILPYPLHNIVICAIPLKFVLCINNSYKKSTRYKIIKIIYYKISWKLETYLKSSKPCIDIRSPLRMFGNLTPLK